MTRQRRIILQHLSEHEGHPSASQIFQDLTKVEPKVGVATVYNTLGVLTRLGYLKVLEFDSHENRYETNLEPHINLICRSCGKILDMPNSWPLEETVAENMQGFSVSDTRFECYGQCPACQSHKEGN
jgi:Fe2+ or Zn2+ uptake regulation protein